MLIALTGWIFAAAGVALIVAGLRRKAHGGLAMPNEKTPTASAKRIANSGERALYWRIRDALPDHMIVWNISILEFVQIPESRRHWAAQLAGLKIQFLVCARDGAPVAALQLGHHRDGRSAESLLESALSAAGIGLITLAAANVPVAQLQSAVRALERQGLSRAASQSQRKAA